MMSKVGVIAVVEKALADETFREQWRANPDAALSQFDLTPEETAAIKPGIDITKVRELGFQVDERISKATLN